MNLAEPCLFTISDGLQASFFLKRKVSVPVSKRADKLKRVNGTYRLLCIAHQRPIVCMLMHLI